MPFLNLIRWQNILLIVFAQVLIKYVLFPSLNASITLNGIQFTLLVISTIALAAAGNIINDIFDVNADRINKPDKLIIGRYISEKAGLTLFITFNSIGILLGFYLSHTIGKRGFFTVFVCISIVLYLYSSFLKGIPILGNIVVSCLVAFSLLIVGIFDVLPAITTQNKLIQLEVIKLVSGYSGLAFILNLIREIIKDIEDINGDYASGISTLPILIGRNRTAKLTSILTCIPLSLILYYVIMELYKQPFAVVYYTFLIIGPLIYIIIQLFSAKSKKEFHQLSSTLKLVMLFGLLSLYINSLTLY
ncbi:geranylgeranylglycerol-phosphate geranylgeranyltransferase [Formosa sp. S-31]|uniref:geranylgeranylglycerol-phosphate geranylgeranyltransferase n=1 Tax=Formosa sp. S-31 TaxID=2790949 RepID=UPI003EC05307